MYAPHTYDDSDGYVRRPRSPLTKRVDQVYYETGSKFNANPWSTPPEFLKVFSDAYAAVGTNVEFECVLFGNPRPRITWFFNGKKMVLDDVEVHNTCDTCGLRIRRITPYHYGEYTIIAENEIGQAVASAQVRPPQ